MSFLFSLYFIKANVPTPALVVKPVSNAPKLKPPDTYNCVSITEPAQLGIKPITPAMIGWKIQFVFKRLVTVSSPIPAIINVKTIFVNKIKIKILKRENHLNAGKFDI